MSEDGKFFILGVGAQKAGTTWLANQLEKASFFSNGGIKEFHVFNKLFTKNKTTNNKFKIAKEYNIKHICKIFISKNDKISKLFRINKIFII